MDRSFHPTEWKPQETTGKLTQAGLSLVGAVPQPVTTLSPQVVTRASFSGVLSHAAQHSGMEDCDIADKIHISHGYMSKFMRSVGEQWAKRLIRFMRITGSLAPLQWLAEQMGCDVTVRSVMSAELAAARALIAEHERRSGRLAA